MEITSIMLRRSGVENDPHAQAVVEIQRGDGPWLEVIREPLDANFSHAVNLDNLPAAKAVKEATATT